MSRPDEIGVGDELVHRKSKRFWTVTRLDRDSIELRDQSSGTAISRRPDQVFSKWRTPYANDYKRRQRIHPEDS